VKRRIGQSITAARTAAAARRVRADEASREFEEMLQRTAVPLFRQIANVLKTAGYQFGVFAPSGSVRLMSDTSAQDFIELSLDTSGDQPLLVGSVSYSRGRRVVETERTVAAGPVRDVSEEQILSFVLNELTPFVEK
jgi:hypothetical protein